MHYVSSGPSFSAIARSVMISTEMMDNAESLFVSFQCYSS